MSNENMNNEFHPIEEPVPIDPDSSRDIIGWIGSAIVIAGSLILFPAMVMPARAKGATVSSKLKWQARQEQAQAAIANAQAAEAQTAAPAPAPPDHKPETPNP